MTTPAIIAAMQFTKANSEQCVENTYMPKPFIRTMESLGLVAHEDGWQIVHPTTGLTLCVGSNWRGGKHRMELVITYFYQEGIRRPEYMPEVTYNFAHTPGSEAHAIANFACLLTALTHGFPRPA